MASNPGFDDAEAAAAGWLPIFPTPALSSFVPEQIACPPNTRSGARQTGTVYGWRDGSTILRFDADVFGLLSDPPTTAHRPVDSLVQKISLALPPLGRGGPLHVSISGMILHPTKLFLFVFLETGHLVVVGRGHLRVDMDSGAVLHTALQWIDLSRLAPEGCSPPVSLATVASPGWCLDPCAGTPGAPDLLLVRQDLCGVVGLFISDDGAQRRFEPREVFLDGVEPRGGPGAGAGCSHRCNGPIMGMVSSVGARGSPSTLSLLLSLHSELVLRTLAAKSDDSATLSFVSDVTVKLPVSSDVFQSYESGISLLRDYGCGGARWLLHRFERVSVGEGDLSSAAVTEGGLQPAFENDVHRRACSQCHRDTIPCPYEAPLFMLRHGPRGWEDAGGAYSLAYQPGAGAMAMGAWLAVLPLKSGTVLAGVPIKPVCTLCRGRRLR